MSCINRRSGILSRQCVAKGLATYKYASCFGDTTLVVRDRGWRETRCFVAGGFLLDAEGFLLLGQLLDVAADLAALLDHDLAVADFPGHLAARVHGEAFSCNEIAREP